MTQHVVVLSGGIDSTAALAQTIKHHPVDTIRTVSFFYAQRHARELESARAIAAYFGVGNQVIDLAPIFLGAQVESSLLQDPESLAATQPKIPEGHYAADTMASTVVQGRNLLFASAALAQCAKGSTLTVGVHAGDHFVYPDCRPEFWRGLHELARAAYDVKIIAPFLRVDKAEVIRRGVIAQAPFEMTWSCYQGGGQHCGRCGTCVERAEAFALARVQDPTDYQDPHFWRTATQEGSPV